MLIHGRDLSPQQRKATKEETEKGRMPPERVGKGTATGKNQTPELDKAPKEARLIPKGNHVAKETLDANESEEQNRDPYRNGYHHMKQPWKLRETEASANSDSSQRETTLRKEPEIQTRQKHHRK